MAQKYFIIKQYLHSLISTEVHSEEFLKCTVAKKSKKAIASECKHNSYQIRVAESRIATTAATLFGNPLTDERRERLEGEIKDLLSWRKDLQAFKPKDYILHYNKVERDTALELIEDAGLTLVLDNEDGTIWDTPKQYFSKYKGNVTIPDGIGF